MKTAIFIPLLIIISLAENQDSLQAAYDLYSIPGEYLDHDNHYNNTSDLTPIALALGYKNCIPISLAFDSMQNPDNKNYLFYVDNDDRSSWICTQKTPSSIPLPGVKTTASMDRKTGLKIRDIYIFGYFRQGFSARYVGIIPDSSANYSPESELQTRFYDLIHVATFKKLDGFTIKTPILRPVILDDNTIKSLQNKKNSPK